MATNVNTILKVIRWYHHHVTCLEAVLIMCIHLLLLHTCLTQYYILFYFRLYITLYCVPIF